MFSTLICVLCVIFLCLYLFLCHKNEYWKKRGVPHVEPILLLGNFKEYVLLRKNLGTVADDICKQFPDAPIVGTMFGTEPAVMVKDPNLIKLITTKDFYYFNGRELTEHIERELFLKNVFSEGGDYWKVVRQHLTPIFSSSKLKNMFYLIELCNKKFEELLDKDLRENKVYDIKHIMAQYTMDCTGSCVFGLETKVMSEPHNNPFSVIADKIFDASTISALKFIFRNFWPGIFFGLRLRFVPKSVETFFKQLLLGVFKERGYVTSGSRHDFVDLLLSLKEKNYLEGDSIRNMKINSEKKKISLPVSDDLLVAQCFIFFAAGFETSASALSYTFYELSKNEEAQRKVCEEVDSYLFKHNGKLEYDCVTELPYLDACVSEAMRMYPALGILNREVYEDYTLPSGLVLKKNMRVHIPLYHMHMNPEYFPDPKTFRPERFLSGERENIVPYTYMPFGEGPRMCIGLRFAKMMMLSVLVTFFKKYNVQLAGGMSRTVVFEPKLQGFQSKHSIDLQFTPREA